MGLFILAILTILFGVGTTKCYQRKRVFVTIVLFVVTALLFCFFTSAMFDLFL